LEAVVERLLARVRELELVVEQQQRVIAEQADRIVELERLCGAKTRCRVCDLVFVCGWLGGPRYSLISPPSTR
jgi:hypothetical protein